ncbi:MAG TPA: hypothetical protein VM890_04335, partial [Longimicrobium sp.]|nr:hypothetical protein [Longimicrobium sp.]
MRPMSTFFIRRIGVAVAAASVVAGAGRLEAQRNPPPAGFPASLDAYLEKAVRDWEVPGLAITVVRNDSVLAAR